MRLRTIILAGGVILFLWGALALTAISLEQARDVALAQSSDSYDLIWWTIDGGGTTFRASGGYELGGAIGQPDAGSVLNNGDYALAGGFWQVGKAAEPGMYPLYLPLVLRNVS